MRTFWSDVTVRIEDEEICVCLFVCQLIASDKTFVCRAEGRGVQSWMRCCERAFRSFGGAPHVTDCTMAAAVHGEAGSATLSAFAMHYKTVLFGKRQNYRVMENSRMILADHVPNSGVRTIFRIDKESGYRLESKLRSLDSNERDSRIWTRYTK